METSIPVTVTYADRGDFYAAMLNVTDLAEAGHNPAQIIDEISRRLMPWAGRVVERFHTEQAACLASIAAELLTLSHFHGLGELLPESPFERAE